ncbi:MAG: TIGR02996 domain-containing protein [Labilithrix sp.]|nr:TIGR02996 domain-containing protein [Labilithrix sp.]MCW5810221.1 TIGR02996 domain-containing protein [Labilithrix sp.]
MSTGDPLLDAIVADPDDDAPRLVWADREGGERGELVILQCRLARRDLAPDERRRLVARERMLLTMNRVRWSRPHGLGEHVVPDFARGFVERASVRADVLMNDAAGLRARMPLLRTIELLPVALDGAPNEEAARAGAARRLAAAFGSFAPGALREIAGVASWEHGWGDDFAAMIADVPTLRGLRAVEVGHRATAAAVTSLAQLPSLERVALPGHRLGRDVMSSLLQRLPTVHRVAIGFGQPRLHDETLASFLAQPGARRLSELVIDDPLDEPDVAAVFAAPSLVNLRRLALRCVGPITGVDLALEALEELVLDADVDDAAFAHVARATFAPHLRRLSLPRARLTAASAPLWRSFPRLETPPEDVHG